MWIIQLPLHLGITLGAGYFYFEIFFFVFYFYLYKLTSKQKREFIFGLFIVFFFLEYFFFGSLYFELNLYDFFFYLINSKTIFEGLVLWYNDFFCIYLYSIFDGDFIRIILNSILRDLLYLIYSVNIFLVYIYDFFYSNILLNEFIYNKIAYIKDFINYYWLFFYNLFDLYFISLTLAGEHFGMVIICYLSDMTVEELYAKKAIHFMDMGILLSPFITSKTWNWKIDAWSANIYDVVVIEFFHDFPLEGFYHLWVITKFYYFQIFVIFDLFGDLFKDSYVFKYSISLGFMRYMLAGWITLYHYFYTTYIIWVFYWIFFFWFDYYVKVYLVWLFIQYGFVDDFFFFYSSFTMLMTKMEIYFVCKVLYMISDLGFLDFFKLHFFLYQKGYYVTKLFDSLDDWWYFWAHHWYGMIYMNWVYWVAGYYYDHDAFLYVNRCNARDFPCPYPCKNLPYGFFLHHFLMILESFWFLLKYAFSFVFTQKNWLMQIPFLYDKIYNFLCVDYLRIFFLYDYFYTFLLDCNIYLLPVPFITPLAEELLVSNINFYEYLLLVINTVSSFLENFYLYLFFVSDLVIFYFSKILLFFYNYIYVYIEYFLNVIYKNLLYLFSSLIFFFFYFIIVLVRNKIDIYVFSKRIYILFYFFFSYLVKFIIKELSLTLINIIYFVIQFFITFIVSLTSFYSTKFAVWLQLAKVFWTSKKKNYFLYRKNNDINLNLLVKKKYYLNYSLSLVVYLYKLFINKLIYINVYLDKYFFSLENKKTHIFFKGNKYNKKNNVLFKFIKKLLSTELKINEYFIENVVNVINSEGYYFYRFELNIKVLNRYFIKMYKTLKPTKVNVHGLLVNNFYYVGYIKICNLLLKNTYTRKVSWTETEKISFETLIKYMHKDLTYLFYLNFYKFFLYKFKNYNIYLKFLQKILNKINFKGLDLSLNMVYPKMIKQEILKKQFFADKSLLYKIKRNPVINFLYKDFFFTKKDFLIFYNNTFFDFFSLILFKKSFSYDFFLKDIFHSILLSFGETKVKYLSANKDVINSSNLFFNHTNSFLKTKKLLKNANEDIESIFSWLARVVVESKKTKPADIIEILNINKTTAGLTMGYELDRIIYELLYNNDNVVFEVLYNKSIKKVPLYSHVNSFLKKIQTPRLRFLNNNVVNEYDTVYNPENKYNLLVKLFLDEEIFTPKDYATVPREGLVSKMIRTNITLETLSMRVKEHPEFSMVEDYFYLDDYNYVYVMYNNVWDLLYPQGELERDDDDLPLFSETMVMFEYTYYLSVGLIEYTSCIFFYEYNLNCIIYHSLVYLYDIVLFYGYNDFNVFGSLGHLKKTYFNYFLENFYNETITLWDVYFFHLNENLSYNSTNRYLQNRFEMFKPDLPINHYRYTNDYNFPGYRGDYTKSVDPDTANPYLFSYMKYFVDKKPYKELSFLTAYFDLDFYVEYIDILDHIYIQDQKLFYYSTVEVSTLNDVNLKLINPRFFTYLDSFLVSPLEQQYKWNMKAMLRFEDNFDKIEDEDQFYDIRMFDFETVYQNLENKVITSEELPYHVNMEYDDIFKDYSRMIDTHIYVASSKSPFELLQQNMINVYTYMGTRYEYNFTMLDEFLFRFYFDYFFFSLKSLTLNTILVGEYQLYLPNYYVFGPVKEYTQDQTMILYDGLNVIKTSKMSNIDKIIMFYKKLRNFCLDMEYFESFKFDYSFFSFSGTYYYGFFFQFILVCFVLFLDAIIYYINFSLNLKHYEGYDYLTRFIGPFAEFMSYAYYEFVLDYEPAEPIEKRVFRSYYPEPFFDMYIFKETDEYEAYSDDEHFVASTVFDSLGFNSYLLDVDNRYFSNNGEFSLLYRYADSLSAKLHMNLYFFRDFFSVLFIRLINYIFIMFLLNPYLILKSFFNYILLFIELCLFCFFVSLNFIFVYIKLFFHKLYRIWFFCINVFLSKLDFIFLFLYYFNLAYIFFFELIRYFFSYIISYCFFCTFIFFKQFGFFNAVTSKKELTTFFNKKLKQLFIYIVKLFKFLFLLGIKFLVIYIIVIFFFDHYDNIIYYLEGYFDLRSNYRSMFVLQIFLIFFGFLLILYPLKLGVVLWSFRYWFLVLVVFVWSISAFTNSTDFFTLPLWGVGTVSDIFKKEGLFYGPMFYEQFKNKGKGGYIWVQTWRLFDIFDDWEHKELDRIYYFFVIDRLAFFNKYLFAIHEAIKVDTGINISETVGKLKYYSNEMKFILLDLINTHIVKPLLALNWSLIPNPFNYMFLSIPKNYREPLLSFFSSVLGDSQFDLIFRNYNLVFSQDVNFFTYNYQLFLSTFMSSSLLHYKFFMTSVFSIIPLFGYNYSYLYLFNFGFSEEKVMRYKYLYRVATMNSLKLNMWGEYKPTASNFFMFYARNWKVLEDSLHTVPYQNVIEARLTRNKKPIGYIDEKMKYKRTGSFGELYNKLKYYKLDILTLMEERLYSSTDWEYLQLDVLNLQRRPLESIENGKRMHIIEELTFEHLASFSVNQFFTPPYNIEIDWQETQNRMLDNTNVNYNVNEPIHYPYNLYVNSRYSERLLGRVKVRDFAPNGTIIPVSIRKDLPFNTEFLQYLVPDLGFYGSTYWGTEFNYFLLDSETVNEQMANNQKTGYGVNRSKLTPKAFHR